MSSNRKKTKQNNKSSGGSMAVLRKVIKYLGAYKYLLILSVILAALTVAGTLYIPILVGNAVDQIVGPGRVYFDAIISILIRIGITAALTGILQWIMNLVNNRITYCIVRDLRCRAFDRLQELPIEYIDSHAHGEIVSRIIADADQFADGLLMGFMQLFTGIATIAGTLFFMLSIKPLIALVVVVLTPISLLMARFIASRTYSMFKKQSEIRAEQTALVEEMVGNQKVVQAFSYEEKAQERFDEINDRLEKCSRGATFFSSLTNPCTRFVNSLVYAAVALTGALTVISGGMTVGNLTSFLSYANQYTKPFNEISSVITELQNALACAGRLFELIEEEPQTADASGAKRLTQPEGRVEFSHVDFSYDKDKQLIEDLNVTVRPGQRAAIVGPTGCGKTTLINLIMRFYDVDGGAINVDGTDVRDITRSSLRMNYGMVLQDTWLFSGTVKDNIRLARPQASDEEVIAAAKAVHAHNFIRRLPEGYDTVIGEEGGLSQGQKQLLSIARVMLCLPPMLILDEATSSIDTRTELKIQDAFAKMMEGRTSFIVAHRLTTIMDADVILVMKDGKIVEQGKHEELIAKGGFYYELYMSGNGQVS